MTRLPSSPEEITYLCPNCYLWLPPDSFSDPREENGWCPACKWDALETEAWAEQAYGEGYDDESY